MGCIKTKAEVKRLKEAANITKHIFKKVLTRIKPGVCESEIAKSIGDAIKQRGLKRSFKTIVASGPNAASPHARPTKRRFKKNDAVVVDFGVVYEGYHSDMTRTVILGALSGTMRKIHQVVRLAQKNAIEKIASGVRISDLVCEVHNYIRKRNLGKYIMHSLGHGVGLKIHEAPKLSEKNRRFFEEGMVVTIEPGLYVKGLGGVRIEDMLVVTRNKAKVLTR